MSGYNDAPVSNQMRNARALKTKAVFKAYRRDVLIPAMNQLTEHFIIPIASLIAKYVGISLTNEEHFVRIVNTKRVVYEHDISFYEKIETVFTVSALRGAEFHLEYIDNKTMLRQVNQRGDPNIQSIAGAHAMFDIPLAFACHLSIAGSGLQICDHYYGPCTCNRKFFVRDDRASNIVHGLREKYVSIASEFIRNDIATLGCNPDKHFAEACELVNLFEEQK